MRLGVGGGSWFARGGVSVGRGGLRGGIGVGPFSLSGGTRSGSGLIGAFVALFWYLMVAALYLIGIALVALWQFVLHPLIFQVLVPRWKAATTTRERMQIAGITAGASLTVIGVVTVAAIALGGDSTDSSQGASSAPSNSPSALSPTSASNVCTIGMNLEVCEDLFGLPSGERLRTTDCSLMDRSVFWAANWWIHDIRGSTLVVSQSSSSCQ